MPVSRNKRLKSLSKTKQENKRRDLRLRGMAIAAGYTGENIKHFVNSVKDKSTPAQYLDYIRNSCLENIKPLDIIVKTRDAFIETPEFEQAYEIGKPGLVAEVKDGAEAIDKYKEAVQLVYDDNIESMKELGNIKFGDVQWTSAFPAIDSMMSIQSGFESALLELIQLQQKMIKYSVEMEVMMSTSYNEQNTGVEIT